VNLYGGKRVDHGTGRGKNQAVAGDGLSVERTRADQGSEACGKKEFALKLRIPGWANGASVRLNDQPELAGAETGTPGYAEIRRVWQPGDFVDFGSSDASTFDGGESAGGRGLEPGGHPARAGGLLPGVAGFAARV